MFHEVNSGNDERKQRRETQGVLTICQNKPIGTTIE